MAENPFQLTIDKASKLRQGFAPLPRVSDKQEHSLEITKGFDHIAQKFLEILDKTQIEWNFVDIARQFFDGHPQIRSKAYIRVFAPWRANDEAWHNALKEFEGRYVATGIINLEQVGLEIQDTSKKEWISSIPEHHPVVKHWGRLQEEAMTILEGSNWSILTPCRYGPNPESRADQIVIYLGVENPYLFKDIGWELIKLCRRLNLEDVSVRVLETSVWTTVGSASNVTETDRQAIKSPDRIRMGSSLNAEAREESGTFGGVVKLESVDGTSETFGLTNSHVIWDCAKKKAKNSETGEETEIEPMGIDAEIRKFGIEPERVYPELKGGISMYSPSHEGVRSIINSHTSFIEDEQSALKEKCREIEEERGGIWQVRDERYKAGREKAIKAFQSEIQELNTSERKIGTVYAASGNRFQEDGMPYVLDWALIKLSPDKNFDNIIPTVKQVGESWYEPKSKLLSEISTSKTIGGKIMQVVKKGRTTGVTVGVVDCLETNVRLENKKMVAWKIYAPNMRDFSQPGDSGSLVLNHEGQLQGLLFGGWDNRFGLMIPIDALVKDIETRTKRKLHL